MRLSPSLPDLTSLYSTSDPASVQSPCPTTSPSPTTGDLPPFSPSTTAPLRCSPNSSPKTNHFPGLDAISAARRAKAGGSKTSVSHGSGINSGQPRKIASLDTGPPLLRRTDRDRRYSLGGSGDYPRSFSVSAVVELSRAESFTAQHRPALPSLQSLSDAAAAAPVAGEQHRGPARSRRGGEGKEKEDMVRGDGMSEGYDSDEDFVKLYGLVAQHRAAERAIVSSAFAKVLSSPAQGSYSPKGGTSSGCSSIPGSGSGFRPKDGTGSGCSSIVRSVSGCLSVAGSGSGCGSIVSRGRMSLDSAVVNVACTGAGERESIQSLMVLGNLQINEQRHGHQQQSQREKSFLGGQSVAVMGTPVASPFPARCAKPENSRVVISQGAGGALEVRIPAAGFFPDGAVGWILCILTPFLVSRLLTPLLAGPSSLRFF
ncbi:unnamed protein product [Closterium sp. Naga37s-1]|nr:unnamed protein product [Closterium sp. Naga37s-1]